MTRCAIKGKDSGPRWTKALPIRRQEDCNLARMILKTTKGMKRTVTKKELMRMMMMKSRVIITSDPVATKLFNLERIG